MGAGLAGDDAPRVLVVDDDPSTLEAVEACLVDDGYVVSRASNGAVGLERVLTFRPDVVVFDFWMPVADGRELVSGIREVARARVGLVAMSGTPEVEDWCGRVGVGAFVRKPFDASEIRRAVKRVLEGLKSISSSRWSVVPQPSLGAPTSKRVRLDRAVLVVGQGDAVRALRGILRESEPPMQVAAVDGVADAIRALSSIAVDAVAICGAALRDPELFDLVAASGTRGVPVIFEASPHVTPTASLGVCVSREPGAESMARSIYEVVPR